MSQLLTVKETAELITQGKILFLAGSKKALSQLPKGRWTGGTIPYFMTPEGGTVTEERVLVTALPESFKNAVITTYGDKELQTIPSRYFSNGMSLIVIPAFSSVHSIYAKEGSTWPGLFNQPIVGWVAGVNLSTPGEQAYVVDGTDGVFLSDRAVVMHLELKPEFMASANIINIFEQDQGDSISFPHSGFEIDEALINGQQVKFSNYLKEKKIDIKLPLVADYMGAMVNVGLRDTGEADGIVKTYAPVFTGVTYKVAKPISNYEKKFQEALSCVTDKEPLFACNCILNFLYANLEGKKIGQISSAMTFGEVAYMLLNQTFVYVSLERKK